jgi:tRNA threonylcarbamoyladenosine biosynthesis protein TsaB
MPSDLSVSEPQTGSVDLVLGVDTCGPAGSVALGRIAVESVQILGQKELAGRTYSATLVTAVRELLSTHGARLRDLRAIVVVSGPGSFTGVRVGVSAVKGLAESAAIPVVAVSRLAVLAWKAGVNSAALDAHRHEVFLRLSGISEDAREMLAGAPELGEIHTPDGKIAICDEAAAVLLSSVWPGVELKGTEAPNASDAVQLAAPRIAADEFVDLALLDGHYLRRSDAEIFGGAAADRVAKSRGGACSPR